jgi:hypothetical protein
VTGVLLSAGVAGRLRMPENKQSNSARPKESIRWKIFLVYLGASLGMILGLNGILIINNNKLFGNQSFLIGIALIGIMYIILAIVFWLFIKKILSPLNELTKNIQVFLEGNWEQRAYLENNDEAGILADQFNIIVDEMVNLYVAQEKTMPEEALVSSTETSLTPIFMKMEATHELDELLKVTIVEISQNLQADNSKLILVTDSPIPQKPDLTRIVKGNGHEGI